MAAATECFPLFTDYSKDNGEFSLVKDEISEIENELKRTLNCKPPRHQSVMRHSVSTATLGSPSDLVAFDVGGIGIKLPSDIKSSFQPVFRSGSCAEKGPKQYMEDVHICIDNLPQYLGDIASVPSPGAFYGVFDGHGGIDAASFIRDNILKFILEDSFFPVCLESAIKSAFLKADYAFANNSSLDISSGTTALTAFISGRTMIVANAGDCRAVLGKRGRAIEMSQDHKPNYTSERLRIEKLGGTYTTVTLTANYLYHGP